MSSNDGTPASQGHTKLDFELPPPSKVSGSKLWGAGLVALLVIAAAFAFGYSKRHAEQSALLESAEAQKHALLRVEVVTPKIGSSDRTLSLPGSVQPLQETVLYARASGYVRAFRVDIGDKVKKGQLLAEIETPELDQELAQARAQQRQTQASLLQAQANRALAKANLSRAQALAPSGVVSRADLEQSEAQDAVAAANVSVAEANVAAQDANIRRLQQLISFAKVTAPFSGTITQRSIEVGALVTAGTGSPLFRIAAVDPARVFVQVPQDVAPSVRAGESATVTLREYPTRTFEGRIARAAGELDSTTRTMNTEIRVPNGEGLLLSGMYAQVSLTLPSPHRVFEVPATALLNDARGARLAVVGPEDKLHLVRVVVERDNGATLDISNGLTGGERIARLGSGAFAEGLPVEVKEAAPQPPTASKPTAH